MTTVPNQIGALFQAMQQQYGDPEANTGQGSLGPWPPEGLNDSFLTEIKVTPGEFFNKTKDITGKEARNRIPATQIQFLYRTVSALPTEKDPLDWKGAPFIFPQDLALVTDAGLQMAIRISRDRLCGHCKIVLGRESDPTDLNAALTEAMALVNAPASETKKLIAAQVHCEYRPAPVRPGQPAPTSASAQKFYKTEFLQKLISS